MKTRSIRIGASLLVILGLGGCRSASKLAWWKSNDADDQAVLASTEPELPSDAAKRTELASAGETLTGGGQAEPFVPSEVAAASPATTTVTTTESSTGGAFPSTGVAGYSPENAIAAVASTDAANGASPTTGGGQAMPYDPNAVPDKPASTVESIATTTPGGDRYSGLGAPTNSLGDRYSSAAPSMGNQINSQPDYSPSPYAAAQATSSTADRYGATNTAPPELPGAPANANGGANASIAAGTSVSPGQSPSTDRYGAATPPNSAPPTGVTPSSTGIGTLATNNSATPYRPGGTSSYPSSGNYDYSPLEVADRTGTNAPPSANSQRAPISTPTSTGYDRNLLR